MSVIVIIQPGRAGDFAVQGLSESLVSLGFKVGRLENRNMPAA